MPEFPDPDTISNEVITTQELKQLVVELIRAVQFLEEEINSTG